MKLQSQTLNFKSQIIKMILSKLLHKIPVLETFGNLDLEVSELVFDSRKVPKVRCMLLLKERFQTDIVISIQRLKKVQKPLFAKFYQKIYQKELIIFKLKTLLKL